MADVATCPTCKGRKVVGGEKCPTCDGEGVKWRPIQESTDSPAAHLDLTFQPDR